jgi:hypothetical protein
MNAANAGVLSHGAAITIRYPAGDGSGWHSEESTLAEFVKANLDGLVIQDIANIYDTLARGGTWHGGGGAAGAYTVELAGLEDLGGVLGKVIVRPLAAQTSQESLVAGAPQDYRFKAMLAVLKVCEASLERERHLYGHPALMDNERLALIRAAISKAEGRTP